jgi:transposase
MKYTLPYYQVVRAKMILLAADGWGNDEIASCLHTRREIVSLWRKRFFEQRLPGLDDQARPGRPRAFFPRRGGAGQGAGV